MHNQSGVTVGRHAGSRERSTANTAAEEEDRDV